MSNETEVLNCRNCRERLSAYDARELDETGTAEVEKHLEACRECAGLLDAIRYTSKLTARLVDEDTPRVLCLRVLDAVGNSTAPDPANAPEIMTSEDLARFLRVTAADLEDELVSIPAFEIAGELRFRRDHVLEWIEEREEARTRQQEYARLRAV